MSINAQAEALLGKLAVHYKLITAEQHTHAMQLFQSYQGSVEMGDILLQQGWIDPNQLRRLHQIRKQVLDQQRNIASSSAQGNAAAPAAAPTGSPQTAPSPPQAVASPAPTTQASAAESLFGDAEDSPLRKSETSQTTTAQAAELVKPISVSGRQLDAYLARAAEIRASDLHIHSGAPLRMRITGNFIDQSSEAISCAQAEAMIREILTAEQTQQLDEFGEVDFAYTIDGVGRFRANAYRQQRGFDATFRVIPPNPPTLAELNLPPTLERFTEFHQGMVLLTGPMGCGKSATMAALVNLINEKRADHILTVEDPIEYLYTSKMATVNQREAGKHTGSFARALRAALREDPDVIVIGELRDLETISLAISAAETGHFVLGTLHTNNAIRTINRLIGAFPPDQQSQIRMMISESLRAVISQRLIPTADKKARVPALETLVVTKAVGNLIRENKTFQIGSILQTGASQGMGLLDESLAKLVASGTITKEEALKHCEDPKKLGGA